MRVADVAHVVRSKNAGPTVLTFDIIFTDSAYFEQAKRSSSFAVEHVCRAIGIDPNDVLFEGFLEQALAYKISVVRPQVSGARDDLDVYGCQQHSGLLDLTIDEKGGEGQ